MIRELLTIGAGLYIVIAIVQAAENPAVLAGSVVLVLLLVVVSMLAWLRDKELVKRYEMIMVWCSILLFLLYALIQLGGSI